MSKHIISICLCGEETKPEEKESMEKKFKEYLATQDDFENNYPRNWICRFHPTDSFHEVGCPHTDWEKDIFNDKDFIPNYPDDWINEFNKQFTHIEWQVRIEPGMALGEKKVIAEMKGSEEVKQFIAEQINKTKFDLIEFLLKQCDKEENEDGRILLEWFKKLYL